REIAAVDHLIGLLGGSRHSADRDAAPHDAGLRARHQSLDFGIIDPTALVDASGEVARSDHGEADAGHSHDLIDALNRLDVLDCYHADHVLVGTRHVFGHRNAPAKRRVEWTPEPIAARRIAHAAHRLFGIGAAADHWEIDAERADIHWRFRQPRLIGRDPHQRHALRSRRGRYHRVRGPKIDRTVLEIDDDPVEPRTRHDLHRLYAGNGRNSAEGGTSLPPFLAQSVEGGGRRGRQMDAPSA